jgi:serine/threonine-protein kinase
MIGTTIGNYQLTDKLGEGGMGAVYRGIDLMLEREVAIKALRPELLNRPDLVERFRSEAVTLAKLNHPNIATLYSFFRQADEYFMVMEFVPGETLEAIVRRAGALSCTQAAQLIEQVLVGLGQAHQAGIVHRDIKLANLMLAPNNIVKLMDFGIARALGNDRMTRAGRMVGTIEYMSPEQIRGQEADFRSDLYSLGIALYELVTARLPFHSDSEYELMRAQIEDAPVAPREIAPHVSPEMEQIILRALAKQPEARFQNAEAFRAALLALLANAPVSHPTSPVVAATRMAEVPRGSASVSEEAVQQPGFSVAKVNSFITKFSWQHVAALAVCLTTSVAGFAFYTLRHTDEPSSSTAEHRSQSNPVPVATPTPMPEPATVVATPTIVTAPVISSTPTATPSIVVADQIIATVTPSPITHQGKAADKQRTEAAAAKRAEAAAKAREAERKRRLADRILNQ